MADRSVKVNVQVKHRRFGSLCKPRLLLSCDSGLMSTNWSTKNKGINIFRYIYIYKEEKW